MQTVSSGWADKTANGMRRLGFGVLVAWMRTTATGVRFFTIGQSRIGGVDKIKGSGSFVTFFDKFRFDDVSPFVASLSVQRKLGQFPYGIIQSEADVELDNSTRKFLPEYDTTIGSGILPNRPIKISIGVEDEYIKLFTGFTSMPDVSMNDRHVNLHSFDAFNFINGYRSQISGAFVNAPLHNVIASGMQEMGFAASQYSVDKSLQQNIGYLATYDRKWGDVFKEGVEAEQALMFSDEDGIIRFWNRQHFLTTSGQVKFQLSYSKLSDLQFQNTPIINDVIVKAKPRVVQPIQRVYESTGTIELEPGRSTDQVIDFTDEFGELPTTSISIPVISDVASGSQSFYTTNEQSDDSGLDRNVNVTLTSSYSFGKSLRLTFYNSSASKMYITKLVIYATPAKVSQVIEERYFDQSSIDNFGRNPANNGEPIEISNDLIQDKATARTLAYTLVNEYKSARRRYVCPVAVQSDPALQIGDAGLLLIQDTGQVKTVYLTGKTDVIQRNADYGQTLEVEERSIKKYFTIGQSRIGGTDSIAP